MNSQIIAPTSVGIGFKPAHLADLSGAGAVPDFLEVHAENYMVSGGPRLRQLDGIAARFPLSLHGVGLSIGGSGPLDAAHLERLDALLHRVEPLWFSEHLAWSGHGDRFYNDLLPVPYHAASLRRVCDHVDQVQNRLRRRLLLENPSTYVAFEASDMDEAAFLAEVVRRTGCGLLLDVNNAYVSAVNHGGDPWAWIAGLPSTAIVELHLAGFTEDLDGAGAPLLIDTHGAPVAGPVWDLYRRVIDWLGPVPTLIEWDQAIPPCAVLLAEARRAARIMTAGAL